MTFYGVRYNNSNYSFFSILVSDELVLLLVEIEIPSKSSYFTNQENCVYYTLMVLSVFYHPFSLFKCF